MTNTHRAIVETSVPPGVELIGAGSQAFCGEALRDWLEENPLGQYQIAHVVEVVGTTLPAAAVRRLYEGIDKRLQDISEGLIITGAHVETLIHELAAAGDDGTYLEPLSDLFTELAQRARTVKEIGD